MTGDLLDEVAHEDDGVWLVTTESGSKYVLDLDAMTVTRLAAEEPVDQQAAARWYVSLPMRRDGETLPVVTIAGGSIKVGECARLVLGNVDNYDGYVSTIRETTPILEIRRLQPEQ